MFMAGGTAPTIFTSIAGTGTNSAGINESAYANLDGFDLIWSQQYLQTQMNQANTDINNIEQNANLSDTEKMFEMQMAMNTWASIANLRTNIMKSVSDTLKTIGRNIN